MKTKAIKSEVMIFGSSCERDLLLPLTIDTLPVECKLLGQLINWHIVPQPIPVNRRGAFTGTDTKGHLMGAPRKPNKNNN